MTRLGSEVIYEFLSLASELAGSPTGNVSQQNARRRRAVSTAYYALFHALSSVCAETLAGAHRDETIVDMLYRALDHAEIAQTLGSSDAAHLAPSIGLVGQAFRNLLERRQAADYAPATYAIAPNEALDLVGIARRAVYELEQLTPDVKLRLAVLLLAKSRPRQRRP